MYFVFIRDFILDKTFGYLISLSLSRGKDNTMEPDQRFIAKDVKYDTEVLVYS